MKIIVLAGGLCTERDVSLASGGMICRALLSKGHDAFLLDAYLGLPEAPSNLNEVFTLPGNGLEIATKITGIEPDLKAVKKMRTENLECFFGPNVVDLCQLADIVFIALHGGEGEDGRVQATFDLLGIRYTGSNHVGCTVSMDKGLTKEIFTAMGISTPKGIILAEKDKQLPIMKGTYLDTSSCSPVQGVSPMDSPVVTLNLPLVIKPCNGGSSIGVYIARTSDEYYVALDKAFSYEGEVVIEEYIEGREFSCGILSGEALPPIEIIPNVGFFDYVNKYQEGATAEICPAALDYNKNEEIKELALKSFQTLKLQVYGRIDFMLSNNGTLYCLEVNSLPGMTPTSLLPKEALSIGMSYENLCETIVETSIAEKYGDIS